MQDNSALVVCYKIQEELDDKANCRLTLAQVGAKFGLTLSQVSVRARKAGYTFDFSTKERNLNQSILEVCQKIQDAINSPDNSGKTMKEIALSFGLKKSTLDYQAKKVGFVFNSKNNQPIADWDEICPQVYSDLLNGVYKSLSEAAKSIGVRASLLSAKGLERGYNLNVKGHGVKKDRALQISSAADMESSSLWSLTIKKSA